MGTVGILESLIRELTRLPGIGSKTAERLAYHLLKAPREEAISLADAIHRLKDELSECRRCHHIAEEDLCSICQDATRDPTVICVVEQPKDLAAVEQTGNYRGLYFVLGDSFSPIEDRGRDALGIDDLLRRIAEEGVREVILATNPDFEGEGTALLLAESLLPTGVTVSRIARGVPTGSQLEYMNRSIIRDAMAGRQAYTPSEPMSPTQNMTSEETGTERKERGDL